MEKISFTATFPGGTIHHTKGTMPKETKNGEFITVYHVYGDTEKHDPEAIKLFNIMALAYKFPEITEDSECYGEGTVTSADGLEIWNVYRLFPKSINFGDLDYNSSADCDIEVLWHYQEAVCTHVNVLS